MDGVVRRFLLVMALLTASCTGASGPLSTTSTTAPAGNDTTTSNPSTTAAVPATASTAWPGVELLVTNTEGVYSIDPTGRTSQLVTGRVAFAVDDTHGGLLFQVERGRSPSWWYSDAEPDLPPLDTRVWWVPRGASQAQELLVPTPGESHDLSLQDAFVDANGDLKVLYIRHDSTFEPEIGPFTFSDSLRTFTLEGGTVVELVAWPGYEAGIGMASGSREAVATLLYGQIESECAFLEPISGVPLEVPFAPDPPCEVDCPSQCVLSEGWLAFGTHMSESSMVTAVDLSGASRQFEFPRLGRLDISGPYLLVNHGSEWHPSDSIPATLIDLRTGDSWGVPPGVALFASAPVELEGLVVPPTPATIQLRPDGLGVVAFGTPADEAMTTLQRALGPPDSDSLEQGPWGEGVTCFMATGFGCDDYLRWVTWGGLNVVFTDRPVEGTYPAMVGWSTSDPRFSTIDGTRVGSIVRELEHLNASALVWMWERDRGIDFRIGDPGIYGMLDDPVAEPVPDGYEPMWDSRVIWLGAGAIGTP